MLIHLGSFSGRIFSKRYLSHAKSARKTLSWDLIFDQRTPRSKAILAFKQKLSEAIGNRNLTYTNDPKVKKALDVLIHRSSISEVSFEKSILSLYKLILQRRILDDELYEVISKISTKDVVNVVIPPSSTKNFDNNLRRPSLYIHPEQKDHLEKVIKKIGSHGKPVTKGDLFQDQGIKDESTPSYSRIDVESLQKYLHKVEQEKSQQKYAWEGTRRYNWDPNLSTSPRLTAGSLIFAHKSRPLRRSVSRLSQRFTEMMGHDSGAQKKPKDLLIYNLEGHSKIVIPASHTNSIFNINYKDLFGVINGSKHAPEEALNVINQLETEGWRLIGDLYSSQNVVFQRTAGSTKQNDGRILYKIPLVSFAVLLTASGLLYVIGSGKRAENSEYHERV